MNASTCCAKTDSLIQQITVQLQSKYPFLSNDEYTLEQNLDCSKLAGS